MPHAAYLVHENVGTTTAQSGAEVVNVQQCLGLVQIQSNVGDNKMADIVRESCFKVAYFSSEVARINENCLSPAW